MNTGIDRLSISVSDDSTIDLHTSTNVKLNCAGVVEKLPKLYQINLKTIILKIMNQVFIIRNKQECVVNLLED